MSSVCHGSDLRLGKSEITSFWAFGWCLRVGSEVALLHGSTESLSPTLSHFMTRTKRGGADSALRLHFGEQTRFITQGEGGGEGGDYCKRHVAALFGFQHKFIIENQSTRIDSCNSPMKVMNI